MKIIVIGGSGLIGKKVVENLTAAGPRRVGGITFLGR